MMQNWFPTSFSAAFSTGINAGPDGQTSEEPPSETTSLLANSAGISDTIRQQTWLGGYSSTPSASSSSQQYPTSTNMDPSLISRESNSIISVDNPNVTSIGEDQVDSYIAQALNKLSMKERDQVYHELHGVDEVINETPAFVQRKLQEFHSQLYSIKETHPKGKALQMALQQQKQQHQQQQGGGLSISSSSSSSSYVFDPKMGLKFLRSESFHVTKAADRMVRFFDLKLFLFGPALLCKEITMDDLSKDDRNTLKAGFIQVLPVRDRAGRAIIVLVPTFQTYKVAENMTRVLFYMFMCALDDEETQKRGFAAIIYDVGNFNAHKTDLKTVVQGPWVVGSVPAKTNSLHHCFNDAAFRVMINLSMKFFGEEVKARAKIHHGTHVECVYALMTFGIPPDALCVTMEGELKRKNHLEWIKMRKKQESSTAAATPRIMVPCRNDVLFGRGKPFREHMGNLRLFNLLDENLDRYENVKLKEKSTVIADMVDAIHGEGGRFLIKHDGLCWVEVDDKQAREKVSHAFRTRLRIQQTSGEDQPSTTGSESNNSTTVSPTSSPMLRPNDHPSSHDYDSPMGDGYFAAKRARTSSSATTGGTLQFF